MDSPQRVDSFKQEVADMRLRDPATARDRTLLRVGVLLMIGGVATALGAYFYSYSSDGASASLQQRDAIVIAIIGLSVCVAGSALFVRYSVAQFLRFWLARLTYEQQAQTDRVVDAIATRDTHARDPQSDHESSVAG